MKAVVGRVTSCISSASKPSERKPASFGEPFCQSAPGAGPGTASAALALRNGTARASDLAAVRRVSIVVSSEAALLLSMSARGTIPIIDLGPTLAGEPGALQHAAEQLRHALTEIGFYFIVNHGIPRDQIRRVYEQAARFHALPLDEKMRIRIDKHNVGYLPMKGDTLRTSVVQTITRPNLNEALFVARDLAADHPDVIADRRFRSANQWPASLPGFRDSVMAYCDALEG